MKDLIQALKANEKPFGLMSEEMQAEAKKIGHSSNFMQYCCDGDWKLSIITLSPTTNSVYRLRPDYEEKPEIVECEVFSGSGGMLSCDMPNGDRHRISLLTSMPDFIGFKYEGEEIISVHPRLYFYGNDFHTVIHESKFKVDKVLTPTHVLFRSKP